MKTVVFLLASWDIYCLRRVASLVEWLDEWGIPQRALEWVMMVLFLALFNLSIRPSEDSPALRIGVNLMLCSSVWMQHSRPESKRTMLLDPGFCAIRGFFQMFMWLMCAGLIRRAPHDWRQVVSIVSQVVFVVFLYVTATHSTGIRGRRRKLAMAELKKMFGDLGWLPAPVGEEA